MPRNILLNLLESIIVKDEPFAFKDFHFVKGKLLKAERSAFKFFIELKGYIK